MIEGDAENLVRSEGFAADHASLVDALEREGRLSYGEVAGLLFHA